jgi:TPR repeat protein
MINIVMARGMSAREKPLLDEALRLDPYSVRVRRVYMHSLRPEWGGSYDAMAAFVQATRKFPETAKLREIVAGLEATILERRGRDTMRAGDTKGALDYYGRALALSENATIYAARASALAKNERFKDAIADHDRALELNPNLTESHTRRGDLYRTLHDTKKALIDIRIAAERGDSEAQNLLGSMYYNGTGVPKNDKESSKWLRLAAAQGNADAQSGYGYMLFHGYGTQPDRNEAVEMWRRSARQGNEDARENLGLFEGFKIKVEMLLARFTGGGC